MQFLVLSRDTVKHYVTDKKHILISIYCHDDAPAELSELPSRVDILRLMFDDLDADEKTKFEGKYPTSSQARRMVYFSEELARQVVNFVRKYLNDVELIICQCDGGISRSPGVAAALSKCIEDDDECFFEDYSPNMLVYSTILKVWNS